MHITGFFLAIFIFGFLGGLLGEGGLTIGAIIGALFIICCQLNELIIEAKKVNEKIDLHK
ncbi:hypothetical protein [Crassaminicella profunda]|uniref:hypothetical protein n=1 Tax=Crassaminicella profunda TaxID=1286698 RepID=UPI001CA73071|nr:hypothetical protein [Crassaminicella profunda]QZY54864.1 hypothetical protein K7H06_17870 [Crassaminicella profunda]